MDAADVIGEVNQAAGSGWRLEERFAAGKQGSAWRIRDGSTDAVMKWRGTDAEAPYNPDAPEIVTAWPHREVRARWAP